MKKRNNIVRIRFLSDFLLLYGLVALCYSPVFFNGFLDSWDDQWMVMNVFTESGFRKEKLMEVFTQSYKGQYSPLVELNYMVFYCLFGYNPFWFHLIGVVWHCVCVTLLFFLIRRLLEMSGQSGSRRSLRVAVLTTFLFAIHPVNVESVAWLIAVKVLMYVFFYLSALLLYLRYVQSQELGCYITALCCFVCSGLCKEQAFVFPLSLLLIDWFIGRNLKSSDLWMEKLPFFILSAGFALLTLDLQGSCSEAVSYTAVQRLLFDSLFFVIHLLLSLHIVAMPRLGIVADRYLYLSLSGILLLVSYQIIGWMEKACRVFSKFLLFLSILFYSLYFTCYTHHYSKQ